MTEAGTSKELLGQAQLFAGQTEELLRGVLPGLGADLRMAVLEVGDRPDRAAMRLIDAGGKSADVPLFVGGEQVGAARLTFLVCLDRSGGYLKTLRSGFSLYSLREKTPLVRLEYNSESHTAPSAHWQFHGERGAFSYWLARVHSSEPYAALPHSLSTLHFPVGGDRFRPVLEDFLEFLVRECGVDHEVGWRGAVDAEREIWRAFQVRSATRDFQAEAAAELQRLGWTVKAPGEAVRSPSERARNAW